MRLIYNEENLVRRNFNNTNLSGAVFTKTDLTGATFKGGNLTGAVFDDVNLAMATFKDANLTGAVFDSVDANRAAFRGANLTGAKFQDTDMVIASFRGANLTGAKFHEVNMIGSNFEGAILFKTEIMSSDVIDGNFRRTDLTNVTIEYGVWTEVNLSGCKITNCSIIGVKFTDSNFSGATMDNELLVNKMDLVDFTGATITNNNLGLCSFSRANFNGVILNNSYNNFSGSLNLDSALNIQVGFDTASAMKGIRLSEKGMRLKAKTEINIGVPNLKPVKMINRFDTINVFDFINGEIPISEVEDENVIFYIDEQIQGFSYPREQLSSAFTKTGLFVSCHKRGKHNNVHLDELKKNGLYFRINLTMPLFVNIGSMKALLSSQHKEWFIKPTSRIEQFTSSIETVQDLLCSGVFEF